MLDDRYGQPTITQRIGLGDDSHLIAYLGFMIRIRQRLQRLVKAEGCRLPLLAYHVELIALTALIRPT